MSSHVDAVAYPLGSRHLAEDRPDSVWWCNTCPGPVCDWGRIKTPPPRCPECHGTDFYPVPWVPQESLPALAGPLGVECPTCHQPPGEPCLVQGTGRFAQKLHVWRIRGSTPLEAVRMANTAEELLP